MDVAYRKCWCAWRQACSLITCWILLLDSVIFFGRMLTQMLGHDVAYGRPFSLLATELAVVVGPWFIGLLIAAKILPPTNHVVVAVTKTLCNSTIIALVLAGDALFPPNDVSNVNPISLDAIEPPWWYSAWFRMRLILDELVFILYDVLQHYDEDDNSIHTQDSTITEEDQNSKDSQSNTLPSSTVPLRTRCANACIETMTHPLGMESTLTRIVLYLAFSCLVARVNRTIPGFQAHEWKWFFPAACVSYMIYVQEYSTDLAELLLILHRRLCSSSLSHASLFFGLVLNYLVTGLVLPLVGVYLSLLYPSKLNFMTFTLTATICTIGIFVFPGICDVVAGSRARVQRTLDHSHVSSSSTVYLHGPLAKSSTLPLLDSETRGLSVPITRGRFVACSIFTWFRIALGALCCVFLWLIQIQDFDILSS